MKDIFDSPANDDNASRVSWMHTVDDDDTLVETVMDHLPDPNHPDPFGEAWHAW